MIKKGNWGKAWTGRMAWPLERRVARIGGGNQQVEAECLKDNPR
jgi:hypothetical protein